MTQPLPPLPRRYVRTATTPPRRPCSDATTLLLAGLALAACRAPVRTEAAAAPPPAPPYVIEDGQAQVSPAFADSTLWIREQLWVETSFDSDGDGRPDRVHVHVTRQRQTETDGLRVPVVYETSPYYAGTLGNDADVFYDVKHELGATPPVRGHGAGVPFNPNRTRISNSQVRNWVPRGFAVVHSESPGTGLSQGCVTIGGPNESLAPKAVIDWLNGRAKGYTAPVGGTEVVATWSTGKVGMTGTSFNGTLPVAAATTGVRGLEAIIPVAPNNSYYRYYRSNGLVRSPGGYLGEDIDVLYDYVQSGDPARRASCDQRVRDTEMAAGLDRLTGDFNDFWAGRDYLLQTKGIRAATLMAHAFNDWNVMPEHSVLMVQALKAQGVPVQLYMHQGGHGGEPPLPMMNRWFTRWLLGVRNGVEQDPKAFIVREGADRLSPTAYPDYPHPDAEPVTVHPTPGGAGIGGLAGTAVNGAERETLVDDVSQSGVALARAARSPHRLLYATPVLTQPVHLSGTARLTIRVASSKPAANLSVWLVELPWPVEGNGNSAGIITRGWADPQNARSLRRSEPLVPGQPVTLTFDLQPDDQVVPAGKRIGLMLFASDRDFTLWPAPGTELTVELGATSLTLPVVGGAAAWRTATGERR
jgi:X-Pro dipeptidyl-peptidase